jgi:hypothetical protein
MALAKPTEHLCPQCKTEKCFDSLTQCSSCHDKMVRNWVAQSEAKLKLKPLEKSNVPT